VTTQVDRTRTGARRHSSIQSSDEHGKLNIVGSRFVVAIVITFYPRDAMLAQVLAMTLCLSVSVSVCLSVTSRCSIEVVGRIELVFGIEASFDQFYTVF